MKLTYYNKTDILISRHTGQKYGFNKNLSEVEMINLALYYQAPIIIKAGKNAKWYLKGKGYDLNKLKKMINNNIGKYRDGVYCILLEFD